MVLSCIHLGYGHFKLQTSYTTNTSNFKLNLQTYKIYKVVDVSFSVGNFRLSTFDFQLREEHVDGSQPPEVCVKPEVLSPTRRQNAVQVQPVDVNPTAPAEAPANPDSGAEAAEKAERDQTDQTATGETEETEKSEKPEAKEISQHTIQNDKDTENTPADIPMEGEQGDQTGHRPPGEDGDVKENGGKDEQTEQTLEPPLSVSTPQVSTPHVPEVQAEEGQQSVEEDSKKAEACEAEEDSMSVSEPGAQTTPTEDHKEGDEAEEEQEVLKDPEAEEAKHAQPLTSQASAKKMSRTKADAVGEALVAEKPKKKDKQNKEKDAKTKKDKKEKDSSKAKKEKKNDGDKKRKGTGDQEATTKRRGGKASTSKEADAFELAKAAAGTRTVLMAGLVFVFTFLIF